MLRVWPIGGGAALQTAWPMRRRHRAVWCNAAWWDNLELNSFEWIFQLRPFILRCGGRVVTNTVSPAAAPVALQSTHQTWNNFKHRTGFLLPKLWYQGNSATAATFLTKQNNLSSPQVKKMINKNLSRKSNGLGSKLLFRLPWKTFTD